MAGATACFGSWSGTPPHGDDEPMPLWDLLTQPQPIEQLLGHSEP